MTTPAERREDTQRAAAERVAANIRDALVSEYGCEVWLGPGYAADDAFINLVADALLTREREARNLWLDEAAALEAEIAADPRHTQGEVAGAHMLGALIRKRARAKEEGA